MTRDPLDDAGAADPGLGALFSDLTSPAVPSELAGQQAAMTMFAAANAARAKTQDIGITQSSAPHRPSRRTAARGRSRPPHRRPARVGSRLVAAAGVLAVAFGFAAAGYAEALPAPLQRVAYHILGFAGVPDSRNQASPQISSRGPGSGGRPSPTTVGSLTPTPRSGSSSSPGTRSGSPRHKTRSPRPGSPSPSSPGSPSPSPPAVGRIVITAAQTEIVAGDSAVITATLTTAGQPAPQATLSLLELAAGQDGWQQVARGKTSAQGQLTLTVPDLTTNASFRVSGPHGARSSEVDVVVAPPVSVSLAGSAGHSEELLVTAPLAQPRDTVELEVSASGGSWRELRVHQLRKGRRTAFTVVVRKTSLSYRVVLLATPVHGQSVSSPVTIAGRARPAGRGGAG